MPMDESWIILNIDKRESLRLTRYYAGGYEMRPDDDQRLIEVLIEPDVETSEAQFERWRATQEQACKTAIVTEKITSMWFKRKGSLELLDLPHEMLDAIVFFTLASDLSPTHTTLSFAAAHPKLLLASLYHFRVSYQRRLKGWRGCRILALPHWTLEHTEYVVPVQDDDKSTRKLNLNSFRNCCMEVYPTDSWYLHANRLRNATDPDKPQNDMMNRLSRKPQDAAKFHELVYAIWPYRLKSDYTHRKDWVVCNWTKRKYILVQAVAYRYFSWNAKQPYLEDSLVTLTHVVRYCIGWPMSNSRGMPSLTTEVKEWVEKEPREGIWFMDRLSISTMERLQKQDGFGELWENVSEVVLKGMDKAWNPGSPQTDSDILTDEE